MRIVGMIAVIPLQGIVGGTYDRFLAGQTAVSDPESQLYLPPDVSVPSPACFHAFQTQPLEVGKFLRAATCAADLAC